MKINNVSLPYPVLGNVDDIVPGLPEDNIQVEVTADAENYYFTILLHHENEDIDFYILDECAEYTCEVTCPRTYLRRCYHSPKPRLEFTLSRREVFGRIEFNCYVTVSKTIPDYRNSQQNEDYGDATFNMEPGDILCAFWPASWNASLKYDKLYSAGSFMVVLNGGQDTQHTWFDSNGDTIKVYLPEELFRQFQTLCNDRNFNELFHASIVFNALFKTLSEYKETVHGTWQWAEAIKYRIDHEPELQDYDIENRTTAYELAQALLQDPYKRLFNHLKEQQNI